jgi:hypothetical protein
MILNKPGEQAKSVASHSENASLAVNAAFV